MNKNLYIGNLTENINEEVIRSNFTNAGPIKAVTIIKDKFTHQSKGFGFVEMETEEGARKAIEMFNKGTLDGKTIVVNEARPKDSRGPRRDSNNRGGGFNRGGRGRGY